MTLTRASDVSSDLKMTSPFLSFHKIRNAYVSDIASNDAQRRSSSISEAASIDVREGSNEEGAQSSLVR